MHPRFRPALMLMTIATVLLPATGFAAGTHVSDNDTQRYGYFATPYSAKGRFVFITRVSRRLLKESVALNQRPQRPLLVREEI